MSRRSCPVPLQPEIGSRLNLGKNSIDRFSATLNPEILFWTVTVKSGTPDFRRNWCRSSAQEVRALFLVLRFENRTPVQSGPRSFPTGLKIPGEGIRNKSLENRRENADAFPASQLHRYTERRNCLDCRGLFN